MSLFRLISLVGILLCLWMPTVAADPISAPALLVATSNNISGIRLGDLTEFPLVSGTQRAVWGVDHDMAKGVLYWSERNRILSLPLSGSDGSPQELVSTGSGSRIYDTALDWVHGNLYWADYWLHTIEVINLKTGLRKVLIKENLPRPYALAVDPRDDHGPCMYWAGWRGIGKAGLDGSKRKQIVGVNNFPGGLAIDFTDNRIYWVDNHLDSIRSADNNLKYIRSADLDGGSPETISRINTEYTTLSMDLLDDSIYYGEEDTRAVYKVSRNTNETVLVRRYTHTPWDIRVVDAVRQPSATDRCAGWDCGASALCLPAPSLSGQLQHTCVCADNPPSNTETCVPGRAGVAVPVSTVGSTADPTTFSPELVLVPTTCSATLRREETQLSLNVTCGSHDVLGTTTGSKTQTDVLQRTTTNLLKCWGVLQARGMIVVGNTNNIDMCVQDAMVQRHNCTISTTPGLDLTQHSIVASLSRLDENCADPLNDDRTERLKDLSEKPVANATVKRIAEELDNLTQDQSDLTHREVTLVTDVTENCVNAPNVTIDEATGADLLLALNRILTVDRKTLIEAEKNNNTPTRLLHFVERLGYKMEGTTDEIKIAEAEIGVLGIKPSVGKGLLFVTTGHVDDDLSTERMHVSTRDLNLTDLPENTATVHLPASIVQQGENIHFVVYRTPSLFEASEKAEQHKLNSWVVAAKVGSLDLTELNDSVTIVLKHLTQSSAKHLCVSWDFSRSAWSPEGCNVASSTCDMTTCQCNHLTNFALLIDMYGTGNQLPETHNKILSVLSYIGFSFSAAGLILTLITYFTFRKLLQPHPSKILVNLCVSLLGIILAFVCQSQLSVRCNVIACKISAVLTHYFLLATMAWMLLEAFNMYIVLVRVLHAGFTKLLLKFCLIGWGIPLIIVGITAAISIENYGLQGEVCWLPQTPFRATVMAPVALTLLLNGTVFGLVIYHLHQRNESTLEMSKRSSARSRLLRAAGIMVLLGLTWVFAFFTIGEAGVVFHYLFVVFNSLQGLFIFVFHCLRNGDARQAWMSCLSITRSGSSAPSSSEGGSNQRQAVVDHSETWRTKMNPIYSPPSTSRTSQHN